MTTVISVKFRGGSRLYYFSPGELEINAGDGVIVETARGTEYGDVMVGIHDVPDDQVIQPLKEVIRVATDRDREMRDSYRGKGRLRHLYGAHTGPWPGHETGGRGIYFQRLKDSVLLYGGWPGGLP